MRLTVMAVGIVLLGGCAQYQARPLLPTTSEADFYARKLSAPFHDADAADPSSSDAPAVWDLASLTKVALYYHPDLDVARAKVASAEAAIVTAGQSPNPTVAFSPQYALNPDPGQSPWTLGLDVDIPIETAGKRGYRIAQAEALSASSRLELAMAAWQVRVRLRAALVEFLFAQRELTSLQTQREAREQLIKSVEQRVAAGEAPRTDVLTMRLELNRSIAEQRAVETRLVEARSALASALGVPVSALEGVRVDDKWLDDAPAVDAVEPALAQRIGLMNRLDIQRSLQDYAAMEAALQLEIAKQYPDLHLGPGYQFDQGQNKLTLGVSVELPIFNQNQGPIAEATAHRQEAAASFRQVQAQAIGAIAEALARYRSVLAEVDEANQIVANEAKQVAFIEQAVKVGEQDRLTLESELLIRAAAERSRIDVQHKLQSALGQLEDALQRPWNAPMPKPQQPAPGPAPKDPSPCS